MELHRRGRSFTELAKEFDLSPTSIANWARVADRGDARAAAGDVDIGDDKARIVRLERELVRKEEELEILGKALAFFARKMEQ